MRCHGTDVTFHSDVYNLFTLFTFTYYRLKKKCQQEETAVVLSDIGWNGWKTERIVNNEWKDIETN